MATKQGCKQPFLMIRLRRCLALLTCALGFFATSPSLAQSGPQARLEQIELRAGLHLIRAEVAASDKARATGLMFRDRLNANEGMLFVFERAQRQCFWMRNTLIPLSIAFIADDGSIINISDMHPQSEQAHCSARPVRFALEMEQGWFARRAIGAGTRLRGPEGLFKAR